MNGVKILSLAAMVLALAALGSFIATRLSEEAIATVAGVLCGIAASIPVSIGLLLLLTRERAYTYGVTQTEPFPQTTPLPQMESTWQVVTPEVKQIAAPRKEAN